MDERIKLLRKTLRMTQDEFGKHLGLARNSIASYEIGRRDPTNAIITSICREFHVNYFWLTEGVGEMFVETPKSVVDEIAEDYKLDDIDKKIIEKYLDLNADQRQTIKDYLRSIFT